MARRFGLRTEIIVNLLLLMGAALLFSGLLLLRLSERELLAERVAALRGEMQLFGKLLIDETPIAAAEGDRLQQRFRRGFAELQPSALFLYNRQLQLVASATEHYQGGAELVELTRARMAGGPVEQVAFSSALFSLARADSGHVWLTVPLQARGEPAGLLQARFSLTGFDLRMQQARQIFLLYAGLYGGLLFAFGLWLLSNAVVRPIRSLSAATRRVAAGDLEATLEPAGPREVAELATDFNTMTAVLRSNRQQVREQIASLEQINVALQRTQDDLLRSEKLASVGRLAAGMAHEIGNPLGAVIGYLELLRSEAVTAPGAEIAGRALAEAERIDRLVRDLLDYAAPGRGDAQRLDPVAVVAEACELLQHQGALEGVQLRDQLPAQLPAVLIPRHKLLQVLVNLLLNARDADPHGTIVLGGGSDGERVWVTVADDGVGMDPETQRQIFDPFFTTKAPGRGRGLGLAVCLRIVEEAGGRLDVVSRLGAGSMFRLALPRAEG